MRVTGRTVRVFVVYDTRLLLLQSARYERQWELPGGKVEFGEKYLDAARRELREETGLICKDMQLLTRFKKAIPHDETIGVEFAAYVTHLSNRPTIILSPTESQRFVWSKLHDIRKRPLTWISRHLIEQYPNLTTSRHP